MFEPKLYRDACRELRLPEEKIQEMIAMTTDSKKKIRRPLGMGVAIAATLALLTVGASAAANPEMAQAITFRISSVLQVGALRQDMTTETGETVTALKVPDARIEDRDGRAVLVVMDQETDITDALEEEGQYEHTYEDTGAWFTILVEGSPEDWTMTASTGMLGEEAMVCVVTTREEQERAQALSNDPDGVEGLPAGQSVAAYQSLGGEETAANPSPAGSTADGGEGTQAEPAQK